MKDGVFRNAYSGLVELNWILLALGSVSIKLPGSSGLMSGAAETEKACRSRKENAGKRNMISIKRRSENERGPSFFHHTMLEISWPMACIFFISLREL